MAGKFIFKAFACFLPGLLTDLRTKKMVGVAGVEPATSCSQSKRASHCATPRLKVMFYKILRFLHLFKADMQKRLDFSSIKLILYSLEEKIGTGQCGANLFRTKNKRRKNYESVG